MHCTFRNGDANFEVDALLTFPKMFNLHHHVQFLLYAYFKKNNCEAYDTKSSFCTHGVLVMLLLFSFHRHKNHS